MRFLPIDIEKGWIAWEREQTGGGEHWGGLLATAGGLLFSADESGDFMDTKRGARRTFVACPR